MLRVPDHLSASLLAGRFECMSVSARGAKGSIDRHKARSRVVWENLEDDVDSTTSDVKANARMPLSLG